MKTALLVIATFLFCFEFLAQNHGWILAPKYTWDIENQPLTFLPSSPGGYDGVTPAAASQNIIVDDQGRMLIFDNSLDYETILTELMVETEESLEASFIDELNSMDYTSYSEHLISLGEGSTDQIKDDLLGAMLNEDFIFQVGDYIYRINKEIDKVFVLHVANITEYDDLVEESTINPNVRQFSTDDDVIELAENGASGEEKDIFCKDRKANKKAELSENVTILSNPLVEMNIEAMYNKYGVYFTLKAIGTHHQNMTELKYYFQIDNSSWTQRCGASVMN